MTVRPFHEWAVTDTGNTQEFNDNTLVSSTDELMSGVQASIKAYEDERNTIKTLTAGLDSGGNANALWTYTSLTPTNYTPGMRKVIRVPVTSVEGQKMKQSGRTDEVPLRWADNTAIKAGDLEQDSVWEVVLHQEGSDMVWIVMGTPTYRLPRPVDDYFASRTFDDSVFTGNDVDMDNVKRPGSYWMANEPRPGGLWLNMPDRRGAQKSYSTGGGWLKVYKAGTSYLQEFIPLTSHAVYRRRGLGSSWTDWIRTEFTRSWSEIVRIDAPLTWVDAGPVHIISKDIKQINALDYWFFRLELSLTDGAEEVVLRTGILDAGTLSEIVSPTTPQTPFSVASVDGEPPALNDARLGNYWAYVSRGKIRMDWLSSAGNPATATEIRIYGF